MASEAYSGSAEPELSLARYSVTLFPSESVLPVLTPDFLRYNEIVPRHWSPQTPVFLGQEFTEIVFKNGFSLQVTVDRVELAADLDGRDVADVGTCNNAALRFLDVLPGLDLRQFSVGLEGYRLMPEGCPGIKNIGTPLEGQLPVVSHQSEFSFTDMAMTFHAREVSRGDSDYINCLDFSLVNSFSEDSAPESHLSTVLKETLEEWGKILERFVELANGFYSRHIEAG